MILTEYGFWIAAWLIVMSAICFAAFGWDKRAARLDQRRISEKRLLQIVILGGSLGAFAAQKHFRHKTRKQPFKTQIWAIFVAQLCLGVFLVTPFGDDFFRKLLSILIPH